MKLIIGLGNPGIKYANNRHNVGYITVDSLLSTAHSKNMIVKKSDKFMNNSGSFVLKNLKAYGIVPEALYVIHDDLDIKLGNYKIQFGKGPKVHNGLNDIYDKLGTKDFWHIRVGVDNRSAESRTKGEDYVLEDFTDEERHILDKAIKEICKKLAVL